MHRTICCGSGSRAVLGACCLAVAASQVAAEESAARETLERAPGYEVVQRECTVCHSEKLIIQNRASREGWAETIRWMQETQSLRSFSSEEETVILDYLAANYAPVSVGRRSPLVIREWHELKP